VLSFASGTVAAKQVIGYKLTSSRKHHRICRDVVLETRVSVSRRLETQIAKSRSRSLESRSRSQSRASVLALSLKSQVLSLKHQSRSRAVQSWLHWSKSTKQTHWPVRFQCLQSRCQWHDVYCFTDVRGQGLGAGTCCGALRHHASTDGQDILCPSIVNRSRARCSAMAESSCDHTVPDLVTRCCLRWSISSAMNTLQCIIWRSNHQIEMEIWLRSELLWTLMTFFFGFYSIICIVCY